MNVSEATRQYQATLEAQRRTRAAYASILSGEDELTEAARHVDDAHSAMTNAWVHHETNRMLP